MKLRTLIITVAVLAALSVVTFVARRPAPPPSSDTRIGQPLLDSALIEKAAKFQFSDQGKTVTLTRQSDGSWNVTTYFDFPADVTKLSGFLGSLTETKIDRLVTSSPERLARLEFKDTKISLADGAGKDLWNATLGKNAESGGRFVRFADEPKGYLANFNAWLDTESRSWAKADLVSVKPDEIAKIEINLLGEPPVVLSRAKKDEPWTADATPAGQKVKAEKVSSLLTSLTGLRFSETTDLNDANAVAAKQHERNYKLTTFDGKTLTVALGRKPEEKKLKPPTPDASGKSGPAALGSVADLAKKENAPATSPTNGTKNAPVPKPAEPEFETIPAGPVFAAVASSDHSAPINAMMQKRAFEVPEYLFNGLPQKPADLFEAAPPPAPAAAPKPATPPKSP